MRRKKTIEQKLWYLKGIYATRQFAELPPTTEKEKENIEHIRLGMILALRWVLGTKYDEHGNEIQ
jgi:hypothetical protein